MFDKRQFQVDTCNYVWERVIESDSPDRPIICSPTGSGKTYMAAVLAKRCLDAGKTFGFLTPREEILWQGHGTMQAVCGETNVAVLKSGEDWKRWLPIHVMSWPTVRARAARSDAWIPDVDVLAIDECHLAMTKTMMDRVFDKLPEKTRVFGMTATPARASGKGLGNYFSNIKHATSVRQLINDGYLSNCEYWGGRLVDVEGVKTSRGDFNSKELNKRAMPLIGDVVDNWARLASDKHTLVFAVDVGHAEALTERFQQVGVKAASLHIHKTPEKRRQIVDAFKRGDIQVLVNVTIASYGFDAPTVDCIVLARPTKSIVLHLQMLGRGMRIHPDKEFCMVLDHADNVRRLGAADDRHRWKLGEGKTASSNWERDNRNPEKKDDPKMHTCEDCNYMFTRSLTCPKCGWEVPLPKHDVESIDADLVRLSGAKGETRIAGFPDDSIFYAMLIGYGIERSFKNPSGWAFHKFLKYTGYKPPWAWKDIAIPLKPSKRVLNWIRKQEREWRRAKAQEARKAGAAPGGSVRACAG